MAKKVSRIIDNLENILFEYKDGMNYETLGDYFDVGPTCTIIQVYTGLDEVERLAVGIHELVEMVILHLRGITNEQVTAWDTEDTGGAADPNMYKKSREYEKAHTFAELVEKSIILSADRDWDEYAKKCDEMKIKWKKKDWVADIKESFNKNKDKKVEVA